MFYNNTQTKQISNSQELKVHLVGLINFYASVLDPARFTTNDSLGKDDPRKPFLKITYDFTKNITITSNKSDWYYLNHL
jgi:hypothetical protein